MLDTIITIAEAATTTYEVGKYLGSLMFGDKQEQYLQQIATDMKDMKVHIERLSDTLLYAVNLDGVRAASQAQQQYFNELRDIRQLLEPLQQALKQPVLSSAMITAPRQIVSVNPRQVLRDISPLAHVICPMTDKWVPVLFEYDGKYYVGWQSPAYLSQLGCEYQAQWQVNQNVLPASQLSGSNPLVFTTPSTTPPATPEKKTVANEEKTSRKAEKKISRKNEEKASNQKAIDEVFRDRLQDGSEGPEMVWIPAGKFKMGDIQGTGENNEKPVHEVLIKRFAMGRYPVTVGEFQQFVKVTDYETEVEKKGGSYVYKDKKWQQVKDANWRNPYFSQTDNQPVVCVSWNDVMAYVEWLNKQTKQQYRLPTEAEWEYAARAGTETDYWWGNEIGINRANCCDSGSQWSDKQTSPVGSFDPNPFGLYDTVGNVWEWTCSKYEEKYQGEEQRCLDNSDSSRRAVRGGAWGGGPTRARVSCRDHDGWNVSDRYSVLGFRLARI